MLAEEERLPQPWLAEARRRAEPEFAVEYSPELPPKVPGVAAEHSEVVLAPGRARWRR